MEFTITGTEGLYIKLRKHIQKFEKSIVEKRREVARELLLAMLERTPVWSGATAGSFVVSNSGTTIGQAHTPTEHGTNWLPLGRKAEKYATSAWQRSLSTLDRADYSLSKTVYITNGSDIWAGIDAGALPAFNPRNVGGVSQVALARVRTMFRYVK